MFGESWECPYNFNFWKTFQWRSLLLYLILSCQKAELIKVCLSDIIVNEKQAPKFIKIMKWIILWLVDDVLPFTGINCKLCVNLQFAISNAIHVSQILLNYFNLIFFLEN